MIKRSKTNRERNEHCDTTGPAQWREKCGGGGVQKPPAPRLDEMDADGEITARSPRPTLVDAIE